MAATEHRCRILLVDDEPLVVGLLEQVLRRQGERVEFEVAHGGRQALERLAASSFDVVVTDLDMPDLDGTGLLEEVRQRCPEAARLIYSGETLDPRSLDALATAHQFLGKRGGPRALLDALRQVCGVRDLVRDPRLRALVGRTRTLPSLPELYQAVVAELESPDTSLKRVGQIVGRDPAMTAKILQIVNSALFGLRTYVTDVAQAVAILGIDTIRTLVLSLEVFRAFEGPLLRSVGIDRLWQHSLQTAVMAKRIARLERMPRVQIASAFVAGMLHDVGKLMLWSSLPREYLRLHRQAVDEARALGELERAVFGASHGQLGGYLLTLWGFQPEVIEAVAWHDRPSRGMVGDEAAVVVAAVHVADAITRGHSASTFGASDGELDTRVDLAFLQTHGLVEHLPAWAELAELGDTHNCSCG